MEHVLKELEIDFHLASLDPSGEKQIEYSAIDEEIIESHLVIINCTPLGMFPDVGSFPPIPYESFTEEHLLFDLTYNPAETVFLRKGREQGAATLNGQAMLELQADKSWEIWNS